MNADEPGTGRERIAFFVPGRIEVLGKHTDYGGGRSLLAAVERGFRFEAVPRDDDVVTVSSAATDETVRLRLAPDPVPAADAGRPPEAGPAPPTSPSRAPAPDNPPAWSIYPATVVRRLARDFAGPLHGADIRFASDLPPAAGLSSSTAFVVGVFLILSARNGLDGRPEYLASIRGPEDLAGYLAAAENGSPFRGLPGEQGVGTLGGAEDHTAMLCAQPGRLVQFRYLPVHFERAVPVPPDYVFAVASSGVPAEKAGDARRSYNAASALLAAAARLWRAETGREDVNLGEAVRAAPAAADQVLDALRQADPSAVRDALAAEGVPELDRAALLARVEHFLAESEEIVPAAGDTLAVGRLDAFGELVDRSQALAERLLGNQIAETEFLARSARELGAAAASAFGAGFGGSVWALIGDDAAASFLAVWKRRYLERFPARGDACEFFETRAGGPARRLV